MSKITDSAKGQDCQLRIEPYCNHDSNTVVLCHLACEDKGTAIKSPDWWGVYGCYVCHYIIDNPGAVAPRGDPAVPELVILNAVMGALYRTQKLLIEQNLIIIDPLPKDTVNVPWMMNRYPDFKDTGPER